MMPLAKNVTKAFWKGQDFWQAVGAIATVFAFIAAAIYACYAHQQVQAMKDTINQTQKLVTEQMKTTIATERAANAASAANTIASTALHIGERPWIEITEPLTVLGDPWAGAGNGLLNVRYRHYLTNVGKSVARNVRARIKVTLDYTETVQSQGKACTEAENAPAGMDDVLFPNSPPIEDNEILSQPGNLQPYAPIHFLGCVVYWDQFGEIHHTRICETFTPGDTKSTFTWDRCRGIGGGATSSAD
jgi:hypothetical protein